MRRAGHRGTHGPGGTAPDRYADAAGSEPCRRGLYPGVAGPQLTDAIALAIRAAPHGCGVVGSPPGRARSVPRPSVTSTAVLTPTTVTAPCSTKTPNTSLLGPAKKRVPRTARSPKGVRTAISLLLPPALGS